MAIVNQMTWSEMSEQQYDQIREALGWERDPPDGVMFHAAAFDDKGAHIFDVWESAEKFQRFTDERLMPGVQQLGIPGQPNVEVREAHAVFAPAYE
jgi:hypothetical protein